MGGKQFPAMAMMLTFLVAMVLAMLVFSPHHAQVGLSDEANSRMQKLEEIVHRLQSDLSSSKTTISNLQDIIKRMEVDVKQKASSSDGSDSEGRSKRKRTFSLGSEEIAYPTSQEYLREKEPQRSSGPKPPLSDTGTNVESLRRLYKKYASDVLKMKHTLMVWANATDLHQGIGDYVAEMLYLRLRELRPDAVAELGFGQGLGTAYILQALEDNGHGVLYTFDIMDKFNRAPKMHHQERWKFTIGDGRKNLDKYGPYDYVHSDCEHSTDFAKWIGNWLRRYKQKKKPGERPLLYSFDDVYKWRPSSKEAKCNAGTMTVAEDGITAEGRIMLDLAKEHSTSPPGSIFSFCCSHFPDTYKQVQQIRYSIGLDENLVSDKRKYKNPDGWKKGNSKRKMSAECEEVMRRAPCRDPQTTIFFDL